MVSYDYFLDRLQPWELTNLFDMIPYADRNQWEQTRLKIFSTASMFGKGQLTVTDIMKFPWDGDRPDETAQEITDDEINRLKAQAETIKKIITANNGTGL